MVNRLLGRAAMGQGRRDDAVKFLETAAQSAQKARGPALAEIYADLGPLYADQKRFDLAITALDAAVKEAGSKPVRDVASRNLAFALLRRGLGRLGETREAEAGLEDLARAAAIRGGLSSKESGAIGCAYALAALKAGKPSAALDALGRATHEGGCTLRAPYDKIGMELFSAYASYREGGSPVRREAAARTFQKLQARAPQPLAETLRDLTRSSYEYEGVDYYSRGDRRRADAALRNAQRIGGRGEHRELENNLAVLDLDAGRGVDAARVFENLGTRPPEALVNLGVVRDREGESRKALDLYKRALERGARTPHLREWIDVKERVFARAAAGAAPSGPSGSGGRCPVMLHRSMRRSVAALAGALSALVLMALPGPAAAQDKLTVAIYAPNAPFDSGDARYSFASRLAQQLSAAGVPAEPKAYARAGDFEAAVKKGLVDFAILDAVFLAERGTPWQVLAVATSGGEASSRWVLIAPEAAGVLDLQGKRLAHAQSGGKDHAFIDNVLLDGELPKLFGARQGTPDIASAVAAVSLKKADAVFAPEAAARGQRHIFEAGRIPNPALVVVKATLPKETIDKVRSAALSVSGGGLYDGWKSASGEPYRSLAGRFGARVRRPAMAEPQPVALDPLEALALPPLEPQSVELKGQYWQPPGRP